MSSQPPEPLEAVEFPPQQALPPSPPPQPAAPPDPEKPHTRRLRIYSHSTLVYWWPVWLCGFVLALLTNSQGQVVHIGKDQQLFHPSSDLGVVFFMVVMLVILITNFSVRGIVSAMLVLGVGLLTVLLAYIGWWDEVLGWFGGLKVYLNLGAYFWFSTLMFLVWAASVFGIDRINYWEVRPGQLTRESLLGAESKSYNAQGMGVEKQQGDLFRNWMLGFGSGDLRIQTSGATHATIDVPNVLFIGSKIRAMQRLISEVPEGPEGS